MSINWQDTRSILSTTKGYTTYWQGVVERSSYATRSIATGTSSKGWTDINYILYLSFPPLPPKVSERTIVPTRVLS